MTAPRSELVDLETTRYYHCMSRCVRGAYLCGEGFEHRKDWLEKRIELLARNFAISVGSFAILDNHFHVLCRLDPEHEPTWSDEEVVRRWAAIFPPKKRGGREIEITPAWVEAKLQDRDSVGKYRERLTSLSWFMKALKEPLARLANKEDKARGAFWQSRFKSVSVLDEEALLTVSAYIDLNVVAAWKATLPEASPHTSIRQRVEHVRAKGELDSLAPAALGSIAGSRAVGSIEQDLWLCPIEDRRNKPGESAREGMFENLSLGNYLLLVDEAGRMFRDGKASISPAAVGILERIGSTAEIWTGRLKKLLEATRLVGSCFTTQQAKLTSVALKLNRQRVGNIVTLSG